MKKLFFLLLFIPLLSLAQRLPEDMSAKVRITEVGSTLVAEIYTVKSLPEIQNDRLYYWYSSNQIHTTQGGYSGRLLNGLYEEYFPNKNLKVKGEFKKGLKDGSWKAWLENGSLADETNWKNGIKSGTFTVYNADGSIKQTGSYKHSVLDGKIITYNINGSKEIITYKSGNVVKSKTVPIWKEIPFLHLHKEK